MVLVSVVLVKKRVEKPQISSHQIIIVKSILIPKTSFFSVYQTTEFTVTTIFCKKLIPRPSALRVLGSSLSEARQLSGQQEVEAFKNNSLYKL